MWTFRKRFKGMICPGMAGSYDDARRVYERKGIWMVEYLRARRLSVNMMEPAWRREQERGYLRFYRRKHFEESR